MMKRERESIMTYIFDGEAVFNNIDMQYMDQVESLVFEMMCDDFDFYSKVELIEQSNIHGYELYKIQDNLYCVCWFDAGESLAYHECFTTLNEANASIKEAINEAA